MSRPRSSAGYTRPKSNNGQDTESVNSSVVNGGRNKISERPGSRGDTSKSKRQIVGQYMIGKTIGEGTFGKVKLAVHIPTGEKVTYFYSHFIYLRPLITVCCRFDDTRLPSKFWKRAE